MKEPKRILIAGLSKTGTSALYAMISGSNKTGMTKMFEPTKGDIYNIAESESVIVKSLINDKDKSRDLYGERLFSFFDKIVYIVRDPRDRMISMLLYCTAYDNEFSNPSNALSIHRILRAKEKNPFISSVRCLHQLLYFEKKEPDYAEDLGCLIDSMEKYPGFVIKYEDFVAGEIDGLSDYLGFIVDPRESDISREHYSRVARTKSSGSWRNWYTPDDVAHYRPIIGKSMKMLGYVDDWIIDPMQQKIKPENCSGYFARVLNERRRHEGLPQIDFGDSQC